MGSAGGRIVKQQCPHVRQTKGRTDNAGLSVKISTRANPACATKWALGATLTINFSALSQKRTRFTAQFYDWFPHETGISRVIERELIGESSAARLSCRP
jgi:hypothetical protein